MKKWQLLILVIFVTLLSLPGIAQANLLSNAGFENGTRVNEDSDPDNWWHSTTGWAPWKENGEAHSGARHVGVGTGSASETSFWGQDVNSGITSGTPYILNAYIKTEAWGSPVAKLQIEFKDSGGNLLRTDTASVLSGQNTAWALYSMTTAAAPSGAAKANAMLLGSNGTVLYDDADFGVVPEPTSMLLLGSGLLGLFAFNRKRSIK